MKINSLFKKQTELLLKIMSVVLATDKYALKGGTAINFFHRNMPRFSMDMDLAFIHITSREKFLKDNELYFNTLKSELSRRFPSCTTQIVKTKDLIPKQLLVSEEGTTIKVEANLVLRGAVYSPVLATTCAHIEQEYGLKIEVKTLSFEDLYAGKFCAALDRQHPRDLFDVMLFFKDHTITDKLKNAFLAYLMSGNRPISELLRPNRLDQRIPFAREFLGMTNLPVTYKELEEAREQLIASIEYCLTDRDRAFLLSFKRGEPDWSLSDIPHIQNFPSIKWKLMNIQQMNSTKHALAIKELERKLF